MHTGQLLAGGVSLQDYMAKSLDSLYSFLSLNEESISSFSMRKGGREEGRKGRYPQGEAR